MSLARMLRHLFAEGGVHRRFPPHAMNAIRQAIVEGEKRHADQVMFAVEGALPWSALWHGRGARERAGEAFANLRVWDTQHNSGVLIYVLLADHAIEILADRGIAAKVDPSQWQAICKQMQTRFAAGDFERGAVEGVHAVGDILTQHFPQTGAPEANELPDAPVVL